MYVINVLSPWHTLFLVGLIKLCAGRQMCYSCSYVDNVEDRGIECVTNPKNWTYGPWKIRCPYVCTISTRLNTETGKVIAMTRGCSGPGHHPPEFCNEYQLTTECWFLCDKHYCNYGSGIVTDDAMNNRKSLMAVLLAELVALVIIIALRE